MLSGAKALARSTRFQRRGVDGPSHSQVRIAQRIDALGNEWGYQPSQLALAWLLTRPGVASAITGPETIAELEQNVATVNVRFSDEQLSIMDTFEQLPYATPKRR